MRLHAHLQRILLWNAGTLVRRHAGGKLGASEKDRAHQPHELDQIVARRDCHQLYICAYRVQVYICRHYRRWVADISVMAEQVGRGRRAGREIR